MSNKFFTFSKPFLNFIDSGNFFRKPFGWLYAIIAIVNLILPLFLLYFAIKENIFKADGKYILAFFMLWLIITFASWISFQLWWDRKSKIKDTSAENAEFVATPVFANFIQTLGEWLGTWLTIVGIGVALVGKLFDQGNMMGNMGDFGRGMGDNILLSGFFGGENLLLSLILIPVKGFLIVVFARFLAETSKAFAAIANNTKRQNME